MLAGAIGADSKAPDLVHKDLELSVDLNRFAVVFHRDGGVGLRTHIAHEPSLARRPRLPKPGMDV